MTKFSPEYLNLADDLLKQFALAGDDSLSAILNKNNIATFQTQYTGGRVRRFPPVKTPCKARRRITEASIKTLLTQSGENLDGASPETWRWHDHRVVITDGLTLSMPDTNEKQQAYPQHGSQKKGLGIPSSG